VRFLSRFALVACVALPAAVALAQQKQPLVIEAGRRVSIEYTLATDDGTVVDTNVGGQALVYEPGRRQLLPTLEQALLGLAAGDSKKVSLSPEEGYGPVDPQLFQTVPASAVPEEAREVGASLVAQSPSGEERTVRIREIKGEEIVVDFNHPLAGEALHFEIRVLSIE
jgi:FKBP-type peptidyl-prolyl cis-trans isomerase SlyD